MKRRTVLAGLAVSVAAPGCLGSSDEPVSRPALIEIQNNTGREVSVEVEAFKDGDQVHDGSYTIDPVSIQEGDDAGEYVSVDGQQIVESWMETPAEFEIEFSVPGYDLEAEFSSSDPVGGGDNGGTPSEKLEDDCYFVRVAVGPERDTITPDPDATPEGIVAWSIVYDHDIFDREHAGDCT